MPQPGQSGLWQSKILSMAEKNVGNLLTPNELSSFCAQVAMILKAGIGVSEGIGVMMEDVKNAQSRQILQTIYDKVEAGEPFFAALDAAGVFPTYVVNMAEIGEKTGKLDDVMESLVAYYEREEAISQSIKSAVTYPLVMIVIMLLVVYVVVVRVLPIFQQVFADLGSEMTGFAKVVMDIGSAVGSYSLVIVGILAVIAIAFLIFRSTKGGRSAWTKWKSSFPLTRGLNAKIASGRFASAMSLMISSGLDPDESLDMVHRLSSENPVISKKIEICKEAVREGSSFADALVTAELFSGIYARMVTVGFRTGSVDKVLQKLSQRYEDDIDAKISGIIAVLEPTLVAILSVIVGLILLSVMLPLMGVMSTIG